MMLPSLIILGVLGVVFGVGLFIASRVFHVSIDPRIEKVEAALPGANCGACGMAGCSSLAKSMVHGSADVTACIPGGDAVAKRVASILGVEAGGMERRVAVIHCRGRNVDDRFEYKGVESCSAANLMHGGSKSCSYGCIGFGDCVEVCPFDAIHMIDGFPEVDESKCVACGKCVEACPKDLIEIHGASDLVHVLCKSRDVGKVVRQNCDVGCIGCGKCERICKFDAIHVVDGIAVIDYEKCKSCGLCVKECPTGAIGNFRISRKEAGIFPAVKGETLAS